MTQFNGRDLTAAEVLALWAHYAATGEDRPDLYLVIDGKVYDIDDLVQCSNCGDDFPAHKLMNGICEHCHYDMVAEFNREMEAV